MNSPLVPQELLTAWLFVAPAATVLALGIPAWFGLKYSEKTVARLVGLAHASATLAGALLFAQMAALGQTSVSTTLGTWFAIGHYHYDWTLTADHLSLPYAMLSITLVGLIGAFSRRYLHREEGYFRFYLLLSLFSAGVVLAVLAGSLDLLFFGWEVVGLTSAMLIAFFHERSAPVRHGLWAFIIYRACDAGLLSAAVWLHHTTGESSFEIGSNGPGWAGLPVPQHGTDALIVGLLLLWASMGKGAQAPLGGWLPRAMEGPTPSSAIFYGAISIHLGPYLLLRAAPVFESSLWLKGAVIAIGLATALHGTFVGRVQSDIKSALAYASMTQVGLIVMEIGLGLYYLALAHVVGHAVVRTLQVLRSPSVLRDHQHLERALGDIVPRTGGHLERLVPVALQPWLYRHALERGYFDAILRDHVVGGALRVLRKVDALDRAWTDWIADAEAEPSKDNVHNEVAS